MVNLCGHYRPGKGMIPITKPNETFGDIYLFQNEAGLWFATVPHTNGGRVSVLGEYPTPGEALKWARFKLSAGFTKRQYKWDKRAWKRHKANVAEWEAHKRRPESGVAA